MLSRRVVLLCRWRRRSLLRALRRLLQRIRSCFDPLSRRLPAGPSACHLLACWRSDPSVLQLRRRKLDEHWTHPAASGDPRDVSDMRRMRSAAAADGRLLPARWIVREHHGGAVLQFQRHISRHWAVLRQHAMPAASRSPRRMLSPRWNVQRAHTVIVSGGRLHLARPEHDMHAESLPRADDALLLHCRPMLQPGRADVSLKRRAVSRRGAVRAGFALPRIQRVRPMLHARR